MDVSEQTSRDTGLHRLNPTGLLIGPCPANRLEHMLGGEELAIDINQGMAWNC